ncbi:hypothetical protein EIP91_003520 [Steccherinum ochraceum]|uniref:Beta-glucuronidase C-terminal domain-containing protein n=1 Tax=Steccherinum ochraceum TaxID=92696 RepID=A0A4R0RWX8_9APHY|nr:hypothetical protein EIP91_003520 [Steccherinum ochraceum]
MPARHPCGVLPKFSGLLATVLLATSAFAAVTVTVPTTNPATDSTAVYSNFLGVSLELSFINYYFGNDSNTVPQPFIEYMTALHQRGSNQPVRLRLGGNSMDSSTYVPDQQQIIQFTDPNADFDDQPVTYGEQLFEVMNAVSDKIGGAKYLIGLSLRTPNSTNVPLLAGDAQHALGDKLDAFLLGNEPDLYTGHGQRPNLANYTTDDYIGDYWQVFGGLNHTAQGDVLSLDKIAGPTICCAWDLASLLQSGWLSAFSSYLDYITLQHYPQNNCNPGHNQYQLDYYLHHSNAVDLAKWQDNGLNIIRQEPAATRKPILMDEFSSASCGGLPGISDTFGVAMWGVDYGLQLAVVGYSGAYLHTRERGISYNLFDPPEGGAAGPGAWTTNPTWYSYPPMAEALQGVNGSKVVDLNVQNSNSDASQTVAGYAIYDATSNNVHHLVLLNFANATGGAVDFTLPATVTNGAPNTNVAVRYLTAPSVNEKFNIAWGNLTWNGAGDGKPVTASGAWVKEDQTIPCAQGCTVSVPGPALAVVYVGGFDVLSATNSSSSASNSTSAGGSDKTGTTTNNTQSDAAIVGAPTMGMAALLSVVAMAFALAF